MRTMQIYTKEGCKFSAQLRELLDEKEIPYEETLVALDRTVKKNGFAEQRVKA